LPVIDRYLEAMVKHKAEQLVFRSGSTVNLVIGGTARALAPWGAGRRGGQASGLQASGLRPNAPDLLASLEGESGARVRSGSTWPEA